MAKQKRTGKKKMRELTLDGFREAPLKRKMLIGGGIVVAALGIYGITRYMMKENDEPGTVKPKAATRTTARPKAKKRTVAPTVTVKATDALPLDIVFNPTTVAQELLAAANGGNLSATLAALRKIKDTQGYEAVKREFIKNKVYSGTEIFPRYITVTSVVNALLEAAFKNDTGAKREIEAEFKRMGLKKNDATGIWTLTGLMDGKATVYTTTDTVITHADNTKTLVGEGRKLGLMLSIRNNIVSFRDSNGKTGTVPYNTIRYSV